MRLGKMDKRAQRNIFKSSVARVTVVVDGSLTTTLILQREQLGKIKPMAPRLVYMKRPPFNKTALIAFFSFIVLFSSCSKHDVPAPPSFTPGYNVYFAGQSNYNAVYWKNGREIKLADNADAYGIALADTNVYVCGLLNLARLDIRAVYWKNGQQTALEGVGISHASGIALNGNDVYCAGDFFGPVGSGQVDAVLWKNGNRSVLSNSHGVARSVYVNGSMIYVVGDVWNDFDSAVVWRNGLQTWYGIPGSMNAIGVAANDTFFLGNFMGASYWTPTRYKLLDKNAFCGSIAFNGTDVYIGGARRDSTGNSHAGYWKNDVFVALPNDYKSSVVNGIAVAGGDVYAAGYVTDGTKYIPVYWKNGSMFSLSADGEVRAVIIHKE